MSDAELGDGVEAAWVDPSSIATRADFVAALGLLRARSGLSLRRLGRAAGLPATTLNGWFNGRHLPFPRDNQLFETVLGRLGVVDTTTWLDALIRVRATPSAGSAPTVVPYIGLASYEAAQSQWYFGRDALIERALTQVKALSCETEAPAVVFVVGPSGSGKSSLLHAGLQPALERDGLEVVDVRLGTDLQHATARLDAVPDGAVVLIDQFEELFTLGADEDQRHTLISALVRRRDYSRMTAVVALRADRFGDVAADAQLAPALQRHQVVVTPLSRDELKACIAGPAQRAGLTVEDDLLEVLLREFAPTPTIGHGHAVGGLPLLSQALWATAMASRGGRMTVADYRSVGGIAGAVEQLAEASYGELDDRDRQRLRRIAHRLIAIDDTGTISRRLASVDELVGLAGEADDLADDMRLWSLLARFADARLFTVTESGVELAHEALLSAWPRLRTWVEEDRAAIEQHRMVTDAALLWLRLGEHPSDLLQGPRLAAAEALITDPDCGRQLSELERRYLDISRREVAAGARADKRRTRRLRLLAVIATSAAVAATGFGATAHRASRDAADARDQALSRQLALRADALRGTDTVLAAHLSIAAYDIAPTVEATSAILTSTVSPRIARLTGGPGSTALALSGDGDMLALSNTREGTIQLASISQGSISRRGAIALPGSLAETYVLAFDEKTELLAAGGPAGTVTLWDVSNPADPQPAGAPIGDLPGAVFGLRFLPDGALLVAAAGGLPVIRVDNPASNAPGRHDLNDVNAGDLRGLNGASRTNGMAAVVDVDGNVTLFDPDTGEVQVDLDGTAGSQATSVAVTLDGALLAVGYKTAPVRLWALAGGAPFELQPPAEASFGSWVNSVAFNHDGTLFAAGSSDRTVRVWRTADWAVHDSVQLPDAVTNVAFLPDDSVVATATDGSARVWDLTDQQDPGLDANTWVAQFDSAGDRLAVFATESAGVWDTIDPLNPVPLVAGLRSHSEGRYTGAGSITPDGMLMVAGTADGAVELIDVSDPADPVLVGKPIHHSNALIATTLLSSDGTLLAVGGDDQLVRLYDISDPAQPQLLGEPIAAAEGLVGTAPISPDDRLLAIVGSDRRVHLVDITDPTAPREVADLGGFDADTSGVAFSPDSRLLAVGAADQRIIIWDISDPAQPRQLGEPITGPQASIFALAFSPDGQHLAAAVTDHSIWTWDVSNPSHPRVRVTLQSPLAPMHAVTYHPDSAVLVGAGGDTDLYLWTADPTSAAAQLCAQTGDPLTADEWTQLVPDRSFESPCPR